MSFQQSTNYINIHSSCQKRDALNSRRTITILCDILFLYMLCTVQIVHRMFCVYACLWSHSLICCALFIVMPAAISDFRQFGIFLNLIISVLHGKEQPLQFHEYGMIWHTVCFVINENSKWNTISLSVYKSKQCIHPKYTYILHPHTHIHFNWINRKLFVTLIQFFCLYKLGFTYFIRLIVNNRSLLEQFHMCFPYYII